MIFVIPVYSLATTLYYENSSKICLYQLLQHEIPFLLIGFESQGEIKGGQKIYFRKIQCYKLFLFTL